MLGALDDSVAQSACGMPVALQVDRLRDQIQAKFEDAVSVLEVDLYSLVDADRDAALDAVVAGLESPFVLVDGTLVCSGAIDPAAVLDALTVETRR